MRLRGFDDARHGYGLGTALELMERQKRLLERRIPMSRIFRFGTDELLVLDFESQREQWLYALKLSSGDFYVGRRHDAGAMIGRSQPEIAVVAVESTFGACEDLSQLLNRAAAAEGFAPYVLLSHGGG